MAQGSAFARPVAWAVCVATALDGCTLALPLSGLTGGPVGASDSGSDGHASPAGDGSGDTSSGPDSPLESSVGSPDSSASSSSSGSSSGSSGGTDSGFGLEASSGSSSGGDDSGPSGPIAFVQVAVATPAGMNSSVSAAFPQAQSSGDLDVVAVGWNDATASVMSVTDTTGNAYALAVGPTRFSPDISQSIYYAPGIHAAGPGANTVTVTFDSSANVVDLRALEYSGLDPVAPFDIAAAGQGNGVGPAETAPAATRIARELLFGAGMSTWNYSGAGPTFTSRVITSLGDIAEDSVASVTGTYAAQAPLGQSCGWVIQLATFH